MSISVLSDKSQKIIPIRRRFLEFLSPLPSWHEILKCWDSMPDWLFCDFSPRDVARLKVKHYKKSNICFNAWSLTTDIQSEWADKSMKVLYQLNRADPGTRFKLRLNGDCEEVTGYRIVRKKMIKMKNISLFSFYFSSLNLFGNEELDLVQHILKRQRHLRGIILSFERIDNLDDEKVRKICHIISKAKKNTFLGLIFAKNNTITREGLANIFGQLTRMQQLQSLYLDFTRYPSMSNVLVEAKILEHYLKKMKNLRALILFIYKYPAIEPELLNIFKKHLSGMRNLQRLTVNSETVSMESLLTQMKRKKGYFVSILILCISYFIIRLFL